MKQISNFSDIQSVADYKLAKETFFTEKIERKQFFEWLYDVVESNSATEGQKTLYNYFTKLIENSNSVPLVKDVSKISSDKEWNWAVKYEMFPTKHDEIVWHRQLISWINNYFVPKKFELAKYVSGELKKRDIEMWESTYGKYPELFTAKRPFSITDHSDLFSLNMD
jgi:hypothetical protein